MHLPFRDEEHGGGGQRLIAASALIDLVWFGGLIGGRRLFD